MPDTPDTFAPALLVTAPDPRPNQFGPGYTTDIRIGFVRYDACRQIVRNFNSEAELSGLMLNDLVFIQSVTSEQPEGPRYWTGPVYRDIHEIDAGRAQRMHATITRLHRGLLRLAASDGHAQNLPELALRVMKVLKIKHCLVQRTWYGSSYDNNEFSHHAPGQVRDTLQVVVGHAQNQANSRASAVRSAA
jgi:hypothetical protein